MDEANALIRFLSATFALKRRVTAPPLFHQSLYTSIHAVTGVAGIFNIPSMLLMAAHIYTSNKHP
jgi:hypothetical protein